jgi:hypothetical protein
MESHTRPKQVNSNPGEEKEKKKTALFAIKIL